MAKVYTLTISIPNQYETAHVSAHKTLAGAKAKAIQIYDDTPTFWSVDENDEKLPFWQADDNLDGQELKSLNLEESFEVWSCESVEFCFRCLSVES